MKTDLIAKIETLIEKRSAMKVMREKCPVHDFYGYFLGVSPEWVQIGVDYDYTYDGMAFLRTNDISRIRMQNRFQQSMLCKEGIQAKCYAHERAPLHDMTSLLAWLKQRDEFTIFDFDYDEDPCLYLGRIQAINKKSVRVIGFDTGGVWWKKPRTVGFEEISDIRIGTHYGETYRKYMKNTMGRSRQ